MSVINSIYPEQEFFPYTTNIGRDINEKSSVLLARVHLTQIFSYYLLELRFVSLSLSFGEGIGLLSEFGIKLYNSQ